MVQSFVAIDFETANASRSSACEVGLVKFVGGQATETYRSYIYQSDFDSFNTYVHGITASAVASSPRFEELWPEILEFIGDLPVVSHNAAFDMSVLYNSLGGSLEQELDYYCTMIMAKASMSLTYNSLDSVAEHFGIDYPMNHRALDDAMAAGQVGVAILSALGVDKFSEAYEMLGKTNRVLTSAGFSRGSGSTTKKESAYDRLLEEISVSLDSNCLEGKKIVFTGEMSSLTRSEASELVAKLGGKAVGSVSKNTDILVYGIQDPRKLSSGSDKSRKQKEAEELRSAGHPLELVDEKTFLEMLV